MIDISFLKRAPWCLPSLTISGQTTCSLDPWPRHIWPLKVLHPSDQCVGSLLTIRFLLGLLRKRRILPRNCQAKLPSQCSKPGLGGYHLFALLDKSCSNNDNVRDIGEGHRFLKSSCVHLDPTEPTNLTLQLYGPTEKSVLRQLDWLSASYSRENPDWTINMRHVKCPMIVSLLSHIYLLF